MKLQLPTNGERLANQRPIRLFEQDDKDIRELHAAVAHEYGVDITTLIRLCVRAGFPLIEKRFKKEA